jgi:hypothetical protein
MLVKLYKQPRGNRDGETVIAEGPSAIESVYWDYDRSQPQGPNAMQLTLQGSGKSRYIFEAESGEVGVFLGEMKLPDVAPMMAQFLARARPEVIGAVVGHIIAHHARTTQNPHG